MSTPELRDGDTILVRAEVKTFIRRGGEDGEQIEYVPMACIGEHHWRLGDLEAGWCVEDRKIATGDRVRVIGKHDRVGTVVAASPPEVAPQQYWVRFPETWGMQTFTREQLERHPPA